MQCREVEVVLEQEGWTPVPEAARAHVAECGACQSLVAHLTAIVALAHRLPSEGEPPARVWTSLRAQLDQEGVIKYPASNQRQAWWHGFADLFRTRILATAAVGMAIAFAIGVQLHRPATPPIEAQNIYAGA